MKVIKLFLSIAFLLIVQQIVVAQGLSSKQDEKTSLYGFVDENDKYIVPPKYKEVDFDFGIRTGGLFKVTNTKDKIGFVNDSGKEIVACKYDEGRDFENGYALVSINVDAFNARYGLLDSTGKEVIALKYGHLEYYPKDKVLVYGEKATSAVGLMDLKGNILIQPQYEFWSKRISNGVWPVAKNDTMGVVNLKNKIIVPFTYEMIENYSDELNVAPARKEGKWGFIDPTGKEVIQFMYEDAWPSGPYLAVKKDGKWGAIDLSNKVILPFEYTAVTIYSKTNAYVSTTENGETYEIDIATRQKVKK